MFGNKEISVVCKQCGKTAPASSFVLDHVYKKMVCPNCIKERHDRERVHKEVKEFQEKNKAKEAAERSKPAGWDAEDAYLEKFHKQDQKIRAKTERLGEDKLRCTCPNCQYQFIYNEAKRYPSNCPYCSSPFKL